MSKVGIFSGTFDPIHAGHISFALAAIEAAGLDKVYILPEQQPRRKSGVTHYAHRVAMIRLALRPYQRIKILELPDRQFSVRSSWPRIKKRFSNDEVYQLVGSDMLHILSGADVRSHWPGFEKYLQEVSLLVGVRDEVDEQTVQDLLQSLKVTGQVFSTSNGHVSSSSIRRALMQGKQHEQLLQSLHVYVEQNWLYASIAPNSS